MAKSKRIRIRGRLSLILFFLLTIFISLCVRIGYLKAVRGAEYEATARVQQTSSYDTEIPPNRGTITDRNGQVLAVSTTVYDIVLDVRVLVQHTKEEQEKTILALSETLEGVDYQTLVEYIKIDTATNKPVMDTSWKILAKQQSREIKEQLEELKIKGVIYKKDTKRRYVSDEIAAHVIGFIRDSMWGIESFYNKEMSGVSGRNFIIYDGASGAIAQEIAAQDGNTVVTTIDYTIQTFAEECAEYIFNEYNPENATTIVMDPNTGEILAMASSPTFNLNSPSSPLKLEEEAFGHLWDEMTTDERYEYLNSVWKNFNISSTFEPGSIFKPIIVAAALEEGIISNSSTYYCGGSKVVADATISCHLRSGHGTLDVEGVLAHSCNVGMMEIGAKLGADTMYKYLKDFGVGSPTEIDLPGEVSARSLRNLMYTPNQMGPVEVATVSFGQGFNVTALQSLNAMATTINGGNYMKPYVVSQIVNKDGNIVKENKPTLVRKVISRETSDIIRQDLVATVEVGTGKRAKIPGYTWGGKTGTAEQGNRRQNEYAISFIGYVPAENPQYIAITLMYKPETYASGVTTVAPATKDLLEKIIKYAGIEPSYEVEPGSIKKDSKTVVDDYKDLPLFDVLSELEYKNLNYIIVGKGNKVVNQVPHGNTEVLEGTQITLYVEKGEDETGTVIIPDVKGKDYDTALTELIDAGLEVVLLGDDIGIVTEISPRAGITVDAGSEVKITLSKQD